MGIAVAGEGEQGPALAVRMHGGREPNLAGAALHLVRVGTVALGQRAQTAAELDDIAVAVVPLLEQRKVVDDLVERRQGVGWGRGHGSAHIRIYGSDCIVGRTPRRKRLTRRPPDRGQNRPPCSPGVAKIDLKPAVVAYAGRNAKPALNQPMKACAARAGRW